MQDKMLREAIADANLIRDTAIANARVQLEEAFKPRMASALSATLRNEQNTLDTSKIGGSSVTVDNPGPTEPSKAASDSSDIENPAQEWQSKTGSEGPDSKPKAVNEDDQFGADHPSMMGGAPDAGVSPEHGGDDELDELDLDAIIKALEADSMNGMDSAPLPQDAAAPAPQQAEIPKEGFGTDVNAGIKPADPTDPTNKWMKQETVDLGDKDANSAGKDAKGLPEKDGVSGGKEVKPGQEVADHSMMETLDLDEILREVEAEEEKEKAWEAKKFDSDKIAAENVNLKARLREHRDVVVYLRDKLNEVNILNSKLLYTNKLFRSFDLDAQKKLHVVETFDRANTVREVKLVYATLAESFIGKSGKAAKKQNASITEGFASKTVASTRPVNEGVSASGAEDAFVSRMQKLAGIKTVF